MSSQTVDRVREGLVSWAEEDPDVSGAALTGSLATGQSDRWSDLDLVLGLIGSPPAAARRWTDRIDAEFGLLHHWDLPTSDARIIRVHLLAGGVEADISFVPEEVFGARGEQWRLLLGTGRTLDPFPEPDVETLVGLAWHHVRHARVCIERGRLLQAEYWLGAVRSQILALACLRSGLPTNYAKGAHLLPEELTTALEAGLVRALHSEELRRALAVLVPVLIAELRKSAPETVPRLQSTLESWAHGS